MSDLSLSQDEIDGQIIGKIPALLQAHLEALRLTPRVRIFDQTCPYGEFVSGRFAQLKLEPRHTTAQLFWGVNALGNRPLVWKGKEATIGPLPEVPNFEGLRFRIQALIGSPYLSDDALLSLNEGSFVTLDTMAGETISVLVEGHPFAHAEVVAIDETFGIRITNIIPAPSQPTHFDPSYPQPNKISLPLGETILGGEQFLSLGEGSILTLDSITGEPLKVLLGDEVLARGEVIVIDDHYGVRILAFEGQENQKTLETAQGVPSETILTKPQEAPTTSQKPTTPQTFPKPFETSSDKSAPLWLNFLRSEHPQTIALVLSFLPPELASQILEELPYEVAPTIVQRIHNLSYVSPQVIRTVERELERKLEQAAQAPFAPGGLPTVMEIMKRVNRVTEKHILESLEEEDPLMAEEIKKNLFVFEDLVYLDDKSLQKVLREVDTPTLIVALKGADHKIQDKVFKNLSKKNGEMLKEDMEFSGPIARARVDEAQKHIIDIIRKLEDQGELFILRKGEDLLI